MNKLDVISCFVHNFYDNLRGSVENNKIMNVSNIFPSFYAQQKVKWGKVLSSESFAAFKMRRLSARTVEM